MMNALFFVFGVLAVVLVIVLVIVALNHWVYVLVHRPVALIHATARIGRGSKINEFAVIDKNVKIGQNCVIGRHTIIEAGVEIGDNTQIFDFCKIRKGAKIGSGCVIHNYVYVDRDVVIGPNCKIQNRVNIYYGVDMSQGGVFVGPNATTTNYGAPAAINPDGSLRKASADNPAAISKTIIHSGVSIGAGAVLASNSSGYLEIGAWSFVGAGSVIHKDVAPHQVVVGVNRMIGYRAPCLERFADTETLKTHMASCIQCKQCQTTSILKS